MLSYSNTTNFFQYTFYSYLYPKPLSSSKTQKNKNLIRVNYKKNIRKNILKQKEKMSGGEINNPFGEAANLISGPIGQIGLEQAKK